MKAAKAGNISKTIVRIGMVWAGLAFVASASAQSYIFSNAAFPTGLRPVFVATGNFNGDGIGDLAVLNQCGSDPTCTAGGSISILLGKPDGTFQSHVDYPLGIDPAFAVVGDFNRDGRPDIAVTNSSSNTVSILLGKGDGTFNAAVNYTTGVGPVSAVTGDFNRDGYSDLAVANAGSQSISIFLGKGDGTFQTHVDYAVSFRPQSVAAADFNGDNKLDLVVADDNVSVLLGNGDGTFKSPVEYPGNGATFVVTADWDGDGKIDVAATGYGDTITILKGNGDGTLQTPYTSYEVGGIGGSIVPVDLNGDGHPDLAVGTSGTLSVLLNRGDGTFQLHGNFGGMRAVSVAAADFNGDGRWDVAVPDPDFNTVNIALGDGRGALGSIFDVLSPPDYPTVVRTGDFNGDGKLDLAMGLQGSGSFAVALGNGDGTFQTPTLNNVPGASPTFALSDFNGDGILDLADFVSSVLNNVQIFLGKGDGTFQAGSAFAVSNIPGQIIAGDFNGDGKMDLATVGFGIVVLLGNGDGTFQAPMAFATRNSNAALAADFNGDGKLDLAILSPDYSTLTVFLGNGDGSFQTGVDYAAGSSPVGLATGDFNGDGNPDLAVVNAGSDTVSIYLGKGDGTFQDKVDYATVQGPRSVAAAGFDGNGKADLLVTGNGVAVLFGNGDGTFQQHQDYFAALDIGPVIAADVDGDGEPDLLVANQFVPSVSVFLNRSAVALRPDQLNFPAVLVGTSSAAQTVIVYNPGIFPLRILGVTTAGDFSQTNTCTPSVAYGADCAISMTFAPATGGERSGVATINDNAVGGQQSIALAGAAMDFSLAAASGTNCPKGGNCSLSATISAGQAATYNLQVSPIGGFNGTVSLSCGGPGSTTCAVSPAAVPPNGSSSYAFTVTVTDGSRMSTSIDERPPVVLSPIVTLSWMGFATMALFMLVVSTRKRLATLALLLFSLGLVPACGGGTTTPPPPTRDTITVNATSNGLARTLTLSLTINH